MGEFLQNDTGKNLSVAWGNPAIPIRNAADLKANAPDAGPGRVPVNNSVGATGHPSARRTCIGPRPVVVAG